MLSRVASSLFWLGRDLERAENYARFMDVNFNLSIDLPPSMKEQSDPLIAATGDRELYISLHGEDFRRSNAIHFLAFDDRNLNSILSTVKAARENARIVRENIPRASWEVLNDLHHYMQGTLKKQIWKKSNVQNCFKEVSDKLQIFNGMSYSTIPRVEGWFFTKVGQYLERADKTSRILDVKYHYLLPSVDQIGTPIDFLHWGALLKSVSAFNAYRKRYGKIDPSSIVDYLVLNRYFPRSILFSLLEAENSLHEISGAPRGYSNQPEKLIGTLRSDLEFADVNDLFEAGLHEYLDKLQLRINKISNAINEQYFQVRPNFVPSQSQQA
ncbi:MAG: alpha-E domain-containing protein [Bacteroidota bacterium]